MAQEIEIIRASLRTPRAAAIAGILFALLLGTALVLVRLAVPADPHDAGTWLDNPGRKDSVVVALNIETDYENVSSIVDTTPATTPEITPGTTPVPCDRTSVRGVGGATQTLSTRDPWEAWLTAA